MWPLLWTGRCEDLLDNKLLLYKKFKPIVMCSSETYAEADENLTE